MEAGDHPAALSPGKTRYPLYRRLGGPQGRSGRVRKISPPRTGIRSPDRRARSESLYRLSYPGSHINQPCKQHNTHSSVCTEYIYWCIGQTHQTWERGLIISRLTEIVRRSQWPRVLKHGSVTSRLLGLRVKTPSGVLVVCLV